MGQLNFAKLGISRMVDCMYLTYRTYVDYR